MQQNVQRTSTCIRRTFSTGHIYPLVSVQRVHFVT